MENDKIEDISVEEKQRKIDEMNQKQQQELDDMHDPKVKKAYNPYPMGKFRKTFVWVMLAIFLYAIWWVTKGDWMEVLVTWIVLDVYILVIYGLYVFWKNITKVNKIIIITIVALFLFFILLEFNNLVLFKLILTLFISFLLILVLVGYYFLLFKINRKKYLGIEQGLYYIGYRIAWVMIIFGLGMWGFVYYNLDYKPLSMPLYTISNGTKTVHFQTMMHIGSQNYYDSVFDTMKSYLKDGYVLYYEGVEGVDEDKASSDKFNALMGVDFDRDVYDNMAKLFGVVNQENQRFIDGAGDKAFNADVHISYVIDKYEEKYGDIDLSTIEAPKDINEALELALENMTDRELWLFSTVEKSMISFLFKNPYLVEPIQEAIDKGDFFNIILDERNKVIAEKLADSDHDKIYIMYGNAHFEGVLQLLQEKDSNWKVVGVVDYYPLK